jgi:chromate transporter
VSEPESAEALPLATPPTVREIFWTFFRVTMLAFGGAAAWVQHVLVIEKRWLTEKEFAEELAICQFLPGPNIVNLAVLIGQRFQGKIGAFTAVFALIVPPATLVTGIGALYGVIGNLWFVRGALEGLAEAAAGLFCVLLIRLNMTVYKSYPREAFVYVVLAFVAVWFLNIPLVAALLVLGPLSTWRAWVRLK